MEIFSKCMVYVCVCVCVCVCIYIHNKYTQYAHIYYNAINHLTALVYHNYFEQSSTKY